MKYTEAGTYHLTYKATDECGNESTQTRTITVEEPSDGVVLKVADVTVSSETTYNNQISGVNFGDLETHQFSATADSVIITDDNDVEHEGAISFCFAQYGAMMVFPVDIPGVIEGGYCGAFSQNPDVVTIDCQGACEVAPKSIRFIGLKVVDEGE